MKGIKERRGKWAVDKIHKGQRITGTFNTQEEAAQHLQEQVKAIDNGLFAPEPTKHAIWTMQKAFTETLALHWKGTKGEATAIKNANLILKILGPATPVTEITTKRVTQLIVELKKIGNTGATINRKLSALRMMLTTAVLHEELDALPLFQRQKESEGRLSFLTDREEEQVIEQMDAWGYALHRDATVVLVDTGLRPGELWTMKPKQVDFQAGDYGCLTVLAKHSKTNRSRIVPMSERVSRIIKARILTSKGGPMFPLNNYSFGYVWDLVREKMGRSDDPEFIPYILRHTCASRFVQAGWPIRNVQMWLGHSSVQTTERYAKLRPQDLYEGVSVQNNRKKAM